MCGVIEWSENERALGVGGVFGSLGFFPYMDAV